MIYLDSCLLIYLAEGHANWGEPVHAAMAQANGEAFALSPLVQCECLIAPIRRGDPVLQETYRQLFGLFVMLPMAEPVLLHAAVLRARFDLRTPDALHLACAQHHRCTTLWTNDDRMAKASHGMALNILARAAGRLP